jgi:6-phosphogluconolactonase
MNNVQRQDFANGRQMAQMALALLLQVAADAITARGRFVLALAGGTTPGPLYKLLARAIADWDRWHLVYTDERFLPYGHPDRNSTMVENNWLQAVGFPPQNHYMPDLEQQPEQAATAYATVIERLLPLDMALLGIGNDGHTASLFPGHHYPDQIVVTEHNAPKPPATRISLGYSTLNAARVVCYLVCGVEKYAVVEDFSNGSDSPAARICGAESTHLMVARDR